MRVIHRPKRHDDIDHDHNDEEAVVERDDRPRARVPTEKRAQRAASPTVRERKWEFAPGQLVSIAAGAGAVAMGLVAVLRAGLGSDLASPTVEVLRLSHTAWLGLAEIALGAVLIVVGTGAWGRLLSVILGAATVVAGVIVLAEVEELPSELGLERDFGWLLIGGGAIVALSALILPVWRSHRVEVEEVDDVDLRDDTHGEPVADHPPEGGSPPD